MTSSAAAVLIQVALRAANVIVLKPPETIRDYLSTHKYTIVRTVLLRAPQRSFAPAVERNGLTERGFADRRGRRSHGSCGCRSLRGGLSGNRQSRDFPGTKDTYHFTYNLRVYRENSIENTRFSAEKQTRIEIKTSYCIAQSTAVEKIHRVILTSTTPVYIFVRYCF